MRPCSPTWNRCSHSISAMSGFCARRFCGRTQAARNIARQTLERLTRPFRPARPWRPAIPHRPERRLAVRHYEHALRFLRLALGSPPRGVGRLVLRPDRRVLTHGKRDDRDGERRVARVGDDPGRGREVGPDLLRGLVERDLHFVVHGPVALARDGRGSREDGAVGDLGHAARERGVRECIPDCGRPPWWPSRGRAARSPDAGSMRR